MTANRYDKNYCSQNEHDCDTCSLCNYGRDCHNNPSKETDVYWWLLGESDRDLAKQRQES